ncbi:hypothetical protein [Clostridium estertheticum]|nr:hypothetical protein [Clostridium estertheticum]
MERMFEKQNKQVMFKLSIMVDDYNHVIIIDGAINEENFIL